MMKNRFLSYGILAGLNMIHAIMVYVGFGEFQTISASMAWLFNHSPEQFLVAKGLLSITVITLWLIGRREEEKPFFGYFIDIIALIYIVRVGYLSYLTWF